MSFTRTLVCSSLTLCSLTAFTTTQVLADPPNRVMRLNAIEGEASFLPAGEEEWVIATRNRPLTTGDALWNDVNTQTSLQLENATLCVGEKSDLTILTLDDKTAQLKLSEGTVNIRVSKIPLNQVYEIDTPNLAFMVTQPGYYRIAVDPENNTTTIDVREGRADVYGENTSYEMNSHQAYRFNGTDLQNYEELDLAAKDNLDDWCSEHLPSNKPTITTQYVSPEVIGYEDLEQYGKWEQVEEYGNVWLPSEVDSGWAPYSDGHWTWIEPWGWTWVGDEPWGFAPYHYGRWVFVSGSWAWVPGPVSVYPVYAPALVAFIGGDGFELSISIGGADVAWFPLGPGDVYWPAYSYSQSYFSAINISAPLISSTLVAQAYHNKNLKLPYANLKAANAITAVPKNVFLDAGKVNKAKIKVANDKLQQAPINQANTLKPGKESILGTNKAKRKPAGDVTSRPVVTKSDITEKGRGKHSVIRAKAQRSEPIQAAKKTDETKGRPAKKDQTQLQPLDREQQRAKTREERQQKREEIRRRGQEQRQQRLLDSQNRDQQRQEARKQRQEQREKAKQERRQKAQEQLQQPQTQEQLPQRKQQVQEQLQQKNQQIQEQRKQRSEQSQQQRQQKEQQMQEQLQQLKQQQEQKQLQRQQSQEQRQQQRQQAQEQRQQQREQQRQQIELQRQQSQQQRQQEAQQQMQQQQQQLQQRQQAAQQQMQQQRQQEAQQQMQQQQQQQHQQEAQQQRQQVQQQIQQQRQQVQQQKQQIQQHIQELKQKKDQPAAGQ